MLKEEHRTSVTNLLALVFSPTQFVTSLCLLFLSLAALLQIQTSPQTKKFSRVLSIITFIFAFCSTLLFPLQLNFGFDQIFSSLSGAIESAHPLRMTLTSGIAFLLLSIAFFNLTVSSKKFLPIVGIGCSLIPCVMGAAFVLSYLLNDDTIYVLDNFAHMSGSTAFAVSALSIIAFVETIKLSQDSLFLNGAWKESCICLTGIALSLIIWSWSLSNGAIRIRQRLSQTATSRASMLQHEIDTNISSLTSTERFFAGSSFVSEDEFRTFTALYIGPKHSIAAIDWAPRTTEEQRPELENILQKKHHISLRRLDSQRNTVPHTSAPIYYPTLYTQPQDYEGLVLGLDHFSDPLRQQAMEDAIHKGQPSSTEVLNLFKNSTTDVESEDLLVFVPVYTSGAEQANISSVFDPRVRGFVVGALRLSQIAQKAFQSFSVVSPNIEFYESTKDSEIKPLFNYLASKNVTKIGAEQLEIKQPSIKQQITIAGKNFTLNFKISPAFQEYHATYLPLVVLISSMCITLSMTGYFGASRKRLRLLKENEKRFKLMVSGIKDYAIVSLDVDGKVTTWNPGAEKHLGYRSEEILGKDFSLFYRSEDVETGNPKSALEKAKVTGQCEEEGWRIRKDGSEFWAQIIISPIYDSTGVARGYSKVTRDITVRYKDERALKEREEYLKLATKAAKIGIWEWTVKDNILVWDESMYRLYGLEPQSLIGAYDAWIAMLHPEDSRGVQDELKLALEYKKEFSTIFRIIKPDKSIRYIKALGTTRYSSNGKPLKMYGTNLDITEIQEIQNHLNERTAQLESALHEFKAYKEAHDKHAIVAVTDRAGKIIETNNLFTEISGYSAEELYGKTHSIINSGYHPKEFFSNMWRTISSGKIWRGDIRNKAKSGKYYWVDTSIVPVKGADGRIERYISIRSDITERKDYEERLMEVNAAIKQAAEMKSQFLANMSHEIRTPLTAIFGFAEQLLDFEIEEQERLDYTQTVVRNAQHLLDIVNDILDFSKIEAGKLPINIETVDIFSLVSFVEAALQQKAEEKSLVLGVEFDFPIPQFIQTDPLRVKQILLNLVGNAIKFTESGGVKLIIGFDKVHSQVEFTVVDTGIGLTEEHIGHLFQVFSQADASTTKRFGGTGLGLAISKKLSHILGGNITVESRYRLGSTFKLSIASGKVLQENFQTRRIKPQAQLSATLPAKQNFQGNVLLAEDGIDNQRLIRRLLEKSGLTVDVVVDGQSAVNSVVSKQFDLILMDMQMPIMDGYTATRLLREGDFKVPIVACTADASNENLARLYKLGCSDVLFKPFTTSSLSGLLSKYFGQGSEVSDMGLDPSEMNELRQGYISRLPERVAQIRSAWEQRDFKELCAAAHKAASAKMFGFTELSKVAKELETSASKNEQEKCEVLFNKFLSACDSVLLSATHMTENKTLSENKL